MGARSFASAHYRAMQLAELELVSCPSQSFRQFTGSALRYPAALPTLANAEVSNGEHKQKRLLIVDGD
jgi:hypothetical protein